MSCTQQGQCQGEDGAQFSLSPHQCCTDQLDAQNLSYDKIPWERISNQTSLHVVDSIPKLDPKVVQKPTKLQHFVAQLTATPAVTPLPFSKAKMETAFLATVMKVLITTICTNKTSDLLLIRICQANDTTILVRYSYVTCHLAYMLYTFLVLHSEITES